MTTITTITTITTLTAKTIIDDERDKDDITKRDILLHEDSRIEARDRYLRSWHDQPLRFQCPRT